ncbi:hypothetical protein ACIPX0_12305 [Streptomyces sp. NPDC090075]|uniref:hypothetical protein n=1 Tax=Streptomyces sp. NPDC090075 TaxID=3365937 RepID=UPI0037FA7B18
MMLLAASSGWDDWLKWLPGWLAFAWAVGNGIYLGVRKVLDHRNKLALGAADDELREALTTARARFEDIIAQGRRADWFSAEERRETGRKIEDLIGRRTDQVLRDELALIVKAWDQAAARAPGASGPWVRFTDQPSTPSERAESARVQDLFGKEADEAREGLDHIKAALVRLDELERRTHGR